MKRFVLFSLCLLIVGISINVEGRKRKPLGHPTTPAKMGWRQGNGPCICKDRMIWHPTGRRQTGHHTEPTGHLTRHHPSRSHSPPRHSHGPPRHSHGPPHSPPHPHRSQVPSRGPHNHPHGHRHPQGPHSPPRRHPQGPTRRRSPGPHRGRPHSLPNHRFSTSPPNRHQRGPHDGNHTKKQHYTRCVCRKPAEKLYKIKFKMMMKWRPKMADRSSVDYNRLINMLKQNLPRILQTDFKNMQNIRFTKGSIVVQFDIKSSEITKDPESAIRQAIQRGQLKELKIKPESLVVDQSYSGVKLTEWTTDEASCHRCASVTQTRKCIEVNASCDGIPLTREASCYEACSQPSISNCGGYGFMEMKVLIIACFIIVGIIVVVAVLVIAKVKKARRKQLTTSPSVSSVKQLTDADVLQSKC